MRSAALGMGTVVAALVGLALLLGAPWRAALTAGAVAGGALWYQRRLLASPRGPSAEEEMPRGSLLKAVGDSAPMAIVVYNDTGRITYANGAALTLFAEDQPLEAQNFLRLVQGAPESLQQALDPPR